MRLPAFGNLKSLFLFIVLILIIISATMGEKSGGVFLFHFQLDSTCWGPLREKVVPPPLSTG